MKRLLLLAALGTIPFAAPLSAQNTTIAGQASANCQPLGAPIMPESVAPRHQIFSTAHQYVYRLAVCISPEVLHSVFHSDKQKAKEWLVGLHQVLQRIYDRDLGIQLVPVIDDRLIVESNPDNLFFNYTHGTEIFNHFIGENKYDAGILILETPQGDAVGMANLSGVYFKHSKGNAHAHADYLTIAHELGHLFGARHTHDGKDGIFTEPGKGQSIMSYGAPRDFFSLPSIQEIRTDLSHQHYYLDAERNPERMHKGDHLAGDNPVHIVAGNPKTPALQHAHFREQYTVTRGTRFQFNIPLAEKAADGTRYAAHPFNPVSNDGNTTVRNLFMPAYEAKYEPCWMFQPYYDQPYNDFGKPQDNLIPYSDNFKKGLFTFLLAAYDRGQYATRAVDLLVVDGERFAITSNINMEYYGGEPLHLQWTPCQELYGKDSQVRILLSEDFGQTFPHVLADNVPNTGSWEGYIPFHAIGRTNYRNLESTIRGGVIKIEVKGEAAYAVSHEKPYYIQGSDIIYSGGFTISGEGNYVRFRDTPVCFLEVDDESAIPQMQSVVAYHKNLQHLTQRIEGIEERSGSIIRRTWRCNGLNGSRPAAYTQIITIRSAKKAEEQAEMLRLEACNLQPMVADLMQHRGEVGYPRTDLPAMQGLEANFDKVYDELFQVRTIIDSQALETLQTHINTLAKLPVDNLILPQEGKRYELRNAQWVYGKENFFYAEQNTSVTGCDLFTASAPLATTWDCHYEGNQLILNSNNRPLKFQRFNDNGEGFRLERGSTWGAFTLVNRNNEAARLNDKGTYLDVYAYDAKQPLRYFRNTSYFSEFQFVEKEDITGTENLIFNEQTPTIYTLTGIRIAADRMKQLPKGIYIINGKKVKIG